VCFEVAREPVVTPCGHLYCWRCINTWLSVGDNVACPVCKGEMTKDMLIPLYGFGANTARGGAKREGGGAPPLESAAGLATLLGLRSSDELSTEQASQLLLSRYLLAIGTLVIVCLLII
jgi:E3 ubiquitin-protein ligase RNF5